MKLFPLLASSWFASLSLVMALPARADWDTTADCLVFAQEHADGAYQAARAHDSSASAWLLNPELRDKVASIWVREGFSLETYSETKFRGQRREWRIDERDVRYHHKEDGVYANLNEFSDNTTAPNVASLRCRSLGTSLPPSPLCPDCALNSYPGRFEWSSAGNHPNRAYVSIRKKGDAGEIISHDDHTYGINATDLALDLSDGKLVVRLTRPPGAPLEKTLTAPRAGDGHLTEYRDLIVHMKTIVDLTARGVDNSYFVIPPKPELTEVLYFLERFESSLPLPR